MSFKGVHFMLELARSSVVDWVQELVTKALSELRMSKHKTRQYAHSIIIVTYRSLNSVLLWKTPDGSSFIALLLRSLRGDIPWF